MWVLIGSVYGTHTHIGLLRRQGMVGGLDAGCDKNSRHKHGGGGGRKRYYLIAYLKNDYGTKLHELRHAR